MRWAKHCWLWLAALVCLVTAGLSTMFFQTVRAETPQPVSTPTVTPTEIPLTALPTVAPEPPMPPSAKFSGSAWVNARPSHERVTAQIGDTVCGEADPVSPGAGTPTFSLYVASAEDVPGCGKPGAEIAFFIGGKRANQTAEWQVTERFTPLGYLVVGPPFAVFAGDITLKDSPVQETVVPFIESIACGYQTNPWMGPGPVYGYAVVVYPKELEPGCGVDGAEVTFKLVNKETGKVTAEAMGKAIWRPMAAENDVNLVFTSVPVAQVPVAGGSGEENGWWVTSALAVAGAVALSVGFGLLLLRSRRRSA